MNVAVFFGTRPEAIKLAPLVIALKNSKHFDCEAISTGQHPVSVSSVMEQFNIEIDLDLKVFQENQSLSEMYSRAVNSISLLLSTRNFDWVIVQGDTSSALAAAMSAFYSKIKVIHIEAGLRTKDPWSPYPEEMNRRLIGKIASFHIAATQTAKNNLLIEGIGEEDIFVSGNTGIDAARIMSERIVKRTADSLPNSGIDFENGYVLVTLHRRESWNSGIQDVLYALRDLAIERSDLKFIFVLHPNPYLQVIVNNILTGLKNFRILEPLNYKEMIEVMKNASMILTDSGGLQEEAPFFSKPVLVARKETERTEGIISGCSKLVGLDGKRIRDAILELSEYRDAYNKMSLAPNPYGDGFASERIISAMEWKILGENRPSEFDPFTL